MILRQSSVRARAWPVIGFVSVIAATSSTVITRSQFVRAIEAISGRSESEIYSFWDVWWWLFVKGWHATEFAGLFLLVQAVVGKERLPVALALAASLAAGDEIHQAFVPRRGAHTSDWIIDCIGIASAALLTRMLDLTPRMSAPARLGLVSGYLLVAVVAIRIFALNMF